MPTWRCPHCGTPQTESSRCWVCKRSSTSCGTCRHFRRAIAGQLGYCGLDPRRLPLLGDERRGCWEGAPEPAITTIPVAPLRDPTPDTSGRPRLDFVPVVASSPPGEAPPASDAAPPGTARRRSRRPTDTPGPSSPSSAPTIDPLLGFWPTEA